MKGKKWLRRGAWCLLVCFLVGVLAVGGTNLWVVVSTKGNIVTAEEAAEWEADCILVLGAGVRPDGTPSAMLQERIDMGAALYELGASDCILMSGDHETEDYNEVDPMKNGAVAAGVPSEAVFIDPFGLSTYESMARTAQIFGAKRVVVVTQEYHLYRALYLARAYGLDAVGVACDTQVYSGQALREVRERAARTKDFAVGLLLPSPAYGGEPVSLDGNGDETDWKTAGEWEENR